jgi:hypothetical protein
MFVSGGGLVPLRSRRLSASVVSSCSIRIPPEKNPFFGRKSQKQYDKMTFLSKKY